MSYDTLAPFYAGLEGLTFGRVLQRARCAPLANWQGHDPACVLVLGDGNGRFLQQALLRWPRASFVSVERSVGMQRLARKRASDPRVHHVSADVRAAASTWEPESIDVIVSHFFLDCFTEESLAELIPAIGKCLKREGVWYISEFTDRAWWQRIALWGMYRFFKIATETEAEALPNYGAILEARGWGRERLGSWRRGWIVAERWARRSTPVDGLVALEREGDEVRP